MSKTFVQTEMFTELNHPRPKLDCSDSPSLTRLEFQDEANVNNLLKRYAVTGQFYDPLKSSNRRAPLFGDFSKYNDFAEMQNSLIEAQSAFDALPVEIRKRFNYDPANLIEWLDDPANCEEAIKLGLLAKAAEAATPETATKEEPSKAAKAAVETIEGKTEGKTEQK